MPDQPKPGAECTTVAYLGHAQWPSGLKPAKETALEIGLPLARLLELADARLVPHWRLDGGAPQFRIREVKEWLARSQVMTRCEGKPLPLSFVVCTNMPSKASDVPTAIRALTKDLTVAPPTGVTPGIYFLCLADEVVYVGQSTGPLARIAAHRTNGIMFDRAFILPCLAEHMSHLEGALIRHLNPQHNANPGPICDHGIVAEASTAVRALLNEPKPDRTPILDRPRPESNRRQRRNYSQPAPG